MNGWCLFLLYSCTVPAFKLFWNLKVAPNTHVEHAKTTWPTCQLITTRFISRIMGLPAQVFTKTGLEVVQRYQCFPSYLVVLIILFKTLWCCDRTSCCVLLCHPEDIARNYLNNVPLSDLPCSVTSTIISQVIQYTFEWFH